MGPAFVGAHKGDFNRTSGQKYVLGPGGGRGRHVAAHTRRPPMRPLALKCPAPTACGGWGGGCASPRIVKVNGHMHLAPRAGPWRGFYRGLRCASCAIFFAVPFRGVSCHGFLQCVSQCILRCLLQCFLRYFLLCFLLYFLLCFLLCFLLFFRKMSFVRPTTQHADVSGPKITGFAPAGGPQRGFQ